MSAEQPIQRSAKPETFNDRPLIRANCIGCTSCTGLCAAIIDVMTVPAIVTGQRKA